MAHVYTEDHLVEQPAIQLFAELGWEVAEPLDETGLFGRETKAEVVLEPRLRAALEQLNPTLPAEAISIALDVLTRDRATMSLAAANRNIYELLKDGVTVSVPDTGDSTPHPSPLPGRGGEGGGQKTERVRVVDWENPANNDFLLVSQFSVTGPLYTCRLDLVGFVNGLPFLVVELKRPSPGRTGFSRASTAA